jgi:uncharacterized protein YjiS (DUF1127 family)
MNSGPMTACMSPATTCTQPGADTDRAQPTLRVRAAGLAHRTWRAYWERRARRATVLILRSLDERTLHDIGISPGEIESCVYSRSSDRRRRYHETWLWRSRQ